MNFTLRAHTVGCISFKIQSFMCSKLCHGRIVVYRCVSTAFLLFCRASYLFTIDFSFSDSFCDKHTHSCATALLRKNLFMPLFLSDHLTSFYYVALSYVFKFCYIFCLPKGIICTWRLMVMVLCADTYFREGL
jgi:hypothetical protein